MDLQGIGALSAAVVALIAVPASMVVGRWQNRAALRTAEATIEAGLAQADSAYRAALDAVRAQASAALLQWRRGIQREAYASFLLAANRVAELGEQFVMDNGEDLSAETIRAGKAASDDALVALRAAQTIIELEGPDEVAAPAAGMTDAARIMSYYLSKQATYERAWGKLGRLMGGRAQEVNTAAEELMQALAVLNRLSSPSSPAPEEPRDAHATRTAEQSCNEARSALPPDALDDEEFNSLLEGWRSLPPTSNTSYLDAVRKFDEAEARFVRAAKTELHGQVPM